MQYGRRRSWTGIAAISPFASNRAMAPYRRGRLLCGAGPARRSRASPARTRGGSGEQFVTDGLIARYRVVVHDDVEVEAVRLLHVGCEVLHTGRSFCVRGAVLEALRRELALADLDTAAECADV